MFMPALFLSLILSPACEVTHSVAATVLPQPQSPGMYQDTSSPRGGTPEPGLIWLIGGGGLAYGAMRRRRANGDKAPKA